ncbi:unnamed protein product [Soboliphyme baturini]|uniref:Palmitoyltransferase n=1 Tax=Soboliphyme baturini TaxID=241478 RepID=A0A3P8CE27_9BILA|nr:unnamed protein product [Soboliphyme baturini]
MRFKIVVNFAPDPTILWWCGFVVPATLVLFLYLNFAGNLWKVMTVTSGCRRVASELVSATNRHWKYCYSCALQCPPRGSHCVTCDDCVLKRDHHCVFAGCCIGYRNHRYYIVAVFHGWLLSQLALCSIWSVVWKQLVAPQLALIARLISCYQFLLATLLMSGLVACAFFGYLFCFQVYLVCTGQTYQEHLTGISCYNLGPLQNLRQIVGDRYVLVWLWPFVTSKLPGNGIDFPTRTIETRVKVM